MTTQTDESLTIARKAQDLADCIGAGLDGGVTLGFHVKDGIDANLTSMVEEGLDGKAGKAAEGALNLSWAINPELSSEGEPEHRVQPTIRVDAGIRENQAIPETGNKTIDYAIDEWSTELANATLTLATETKNGTTDTTTLATVNATQVNTTYEANTTLDLVHGTTYDLELAVTDAYGWNTSDHVRFTSDVNLPGLSVIDGPTPSVPGDEENQVFTANATVETSWEVEDPTTGLASVVLERYQDQDGDGEATWTPVHKFVDDPETPPSTLTASATMNLTDLVTGDTAHYRLVARDQAGNTAIQHHNLTFDARAPFLSDGDFELGREWEHISTDLTFNGSWDIYEAAPGESGVAWVRAGLFNTTSQQTHWAKNTTYPNWGVVSDKTTLQGYPNTTYHLALEAGDRLGNTRTWSHPDETDWVDVQIFPKFDPEIPGPNTTVIEALTMNLTTGFPTFPGLGVDHAGITVDHDNDTVFEAHGEDVDDEFAVFWENTTLPSGTYNVNMSTRHGKALVWYPFNVTRDAATYPTLTSQGLHGSINETEQGHVFHFAFPRNCDGDATFLLDGYGKDADLYATEGQVTTTDPEAYTHAANGTATNHQITLPMSTGEDASLLVETTAPGLTDYRLDVDPDCPDDPDDTDDSGPRDHESTMLK